MKIWNLMMRVRRVSIEKFSKGTKILFKIHWIQMNIIFSFLFAFMKGKMFVHYLIWMIIYLMTVVFDVILPAEHKFGLKNNLDCQDSKKNGIKHANLDF